VVRSFFSSFPPLHSRRCRLAGKQRSLIIAFDIFIALLVIGTVAYRFLLIESNYLDSLYFCIQSVITTGFGDITPDTTGTPPSS
jgi:hypothetical protein